MTPPQTPLDLTLSRVGDRWSLLVVEALLEGPRRFNELHAALPGVATNVLSQRLKHLETQRVVVSRPYSERPLRYAYDLTAGGRRLAGALRLLAQWSRGESRETVGAPEHGPCGTPLEAQWYCPTCDRLVDEADATGVTFI